MIFLDLSEGMENCKMSGKSQGIVRWMISGNPGNLYHRVPADNQTAPKV